VDGGGSMRLLVEQDRLGHLTALAAGA